MSSHVDLAVLVSRSPSPSTLPEMGFVCARRHRVPTVAIDPVLAADELWHIDSETSPAIHRLETEDACAVQQRMPPGTTASVRRSARRVIVTVDHRASDVSSNERLAIADRARQAMRAHDPYIAVIDIIVQRSADIGHIEEAP